MQRAFSMSIGLGRADALAEGQLEADLARPAALGVGGRGDVGRAVGLDQVLEPGAAVAVGEQRQRLGAVLLADLAAASRRRRRAPCPRRPPRSILLAALARRGSAASSAGPDRRADPVPPVPRGQSRPRDRGWSGLPLILVTRPSLTWASTPHFQKQSSQKVGTTRSPSVCGSVHGVGVQAPPVGRQAGAQGHRADAGAGAVILMNCLRVTAISSLLSQRGGMEHPSMQRTICLSCGSVRW